MNKTTKELENELEKIESVEDFSNYIENNKESIKRERFSDRLYNICKEKNITYSDILNSNVSISKSHFYALLNGTRNPAREQVIKIAVGLQLSLEETNELLKLADYKELYPKIKEDNIIIFGIKMKKNINEVESLLIEYDCNLSLFSKE